MKYCCRCGSQFEQLTDRYRKQCYECVPFGTKIYRAKPAGDCVCKVCGRQYEYDRSKGHRKTMCGSCSVNERRFAVKDRCLAYKGNKCIICAYDKCKRALTFHHVDDHTKEFGIGGSHARSWLVLQKELDKVRTPMCKLPC